MNANAWRILGAIVAGMIALPASAQQGTPAMPVSQQNALVQKHCAVCHSDTKMMGGLSLEVFDAVHPDPSIAGMMVNKLNSGAMGPPAYRYRIVPSSMHWLLHCPTRPPMLPRRLVVRRSRP